MTRLDQRLQGNRLLTLYIDGASKGNPGTAGAGIWMADEKGKKIFQRCQYLGYRTNNEAEYEALLLGLKEAQRLAQRLGPISIRIYTDSELVEKQINGLYQVKNLNLKALHASALKYLGGFSSYTIESITREMNQEADRLANEAIQRAAKEKKRGREEPMVAPHSCEGRKVRAP